MPNPSPLLEPSRFRWADRHNLLRRDMEVVTEGLSETGRFLPALREKIEHHRKDDLQQLTNAHQEAYVRWGERLARLEEWKARAAQLSLPGERLVSWRASVVWFDRAKVIGRRYAAVLGRRAERVEKRFAELGEGIQQWLSRLTGKENELRAAIERQPVAAAEPPVVTAAQKGPFLDFVYLEREEQGRLANLFDSLRATTDRTLERLARIDQRIEARAEANPAYFEIHKSEFLDIYHPLQRRFAPLRQAIASQAASFEEGRHRLRSMYEAVHKMRTVDPPAPRKRSLLQRLFNINGD